MGRASTASFPAGSYRNSSTYAYCPADNICDGTSSPKPCGTGSYQPNMDSTSCIQTPPGNFTNTTGSAVAILCALESYRPYVQQSFILLRGSQWSVPTIVRKVVSLWNVLGMVGTAEQKQRERSQLHCPDALCMVLLWGRVYFVPDSCTPKPVRRLPTGPTPPRLSGDRCGDIAESSL
ncbi:hypothetical protein MVEN_02023300 [Mycena venus]|uniref:Uncharacterized protein n=1 Tax=Mycena venus TaxID=2733690 RepID=A0A8H6XC30_9AGAR|nr:hypothetical protein MVEN_02023300 [Mycena venus]